jgi:citrate lyase beta subunit
MIDLSTVRSLLFVPATKLEKLDAVHKASGADLYVIDLEDSVLPDLKEAMRERAGLFFDQRRTQGMHAAPPLVGVRINPIAGLNGLMDFLAVTSGEQLPDVLVLPKMEVAHEIDLLDGWMTDMGIQIPVIPLIETLNVWEELDLIMAHELVPSAMLGGIDLAAELGCEPGWEPMFPYRSALVHAARKHGKGCMDMPWFDLEDQDGLRADTLRARSLGFDGRAAIHPGQVAVIHECFTPDSARIEQARAMVEAFNNASDGVAVFKGKVLEKPVILQAQRILDLAERSANSQ